MSVWGRLQINFLMVFSDCQLCALCVDKDCQYSDHITHQLSVCTEFLICQMKNSTMQDGAMFVRNMNL